LVPLQTERLGREQEAPWAVAATAVPVPAAPAPVPAVTELNAQAFDPVALAMSMASDDEALAPSVPVLHSLATSASNDEINAVEEAIFLAQGIQVLPPDGISLKQHLVDIERSLIEQALSRTQGNVSRTAKLLQLQRTTLIEKINKYELRAGS
jgi:sigma-54 specific flagellar transcriptional regulator A